MTDIIIAFVVPVIAIILSILLETLIRCPYKVAGIIFVGLMITAFALGGTLEYIILAWIYTALAFVVALITERVISNNSSCNSCSSNCNCSNSSSCSSSCSSCNSCSRCGYRN